MSSQGTRAGDWRARPTPDSSEEGNEPGAGCTDFPSTGGVRGGFLSGCFSCDVGTSGMRFRKTRLTAPMMALKVKSTANCRGRVCPARHAAEIKKVTKLATFCTAASRTRYFPRNAAGTSTVIQGSHAQLEMPRDRLKQNNSARSKASRLAAVRNAPVKGTSAMMKMNVTRVLQPARTKRRYPMRLTWLAAGI